MAILRASEIRELNQKELELKLKGLRSELSRERAHVSSGTRPENPGRLRIIRKTIARILTINKEPKVTVSVKKTKITNVKKTAIKTKETVKKEETKTTVVKKKPTVIKKVKEKK